MYWEVWAAVIWLHVLDIILEPNDFFLWDFVFPKNTMITLVDVPIFPPDINFQQYRR